MDDKTIDELNAILRNIFDEIAALRVDIGWLKNDHRKFEHQLDELGESRTR